MSTKEENKPLTLWECKDKIANNHGYNNYSMAMIDFGRGNIGFEVILKFNTYAAELYASQFRSTSQINIDWIIQEVIDTCKEHAEDGCFDYDGAKANSMRIIKSQFRSTPPEQWIPISKGLPEDERDNVLWARFPLVEPYYFGSILDGGVDIRWHTHWIRIDSLLPPPPGHKDR